jgi:hypothetical protein
MGVLEDIEERLAAVERELETLKGRLDKEDQQIVVPKEYQLIVQRLRDAGYEGARMFQVNPWSVVIRAGGVEQSVHLGVGGALGRMSAWADEMIRASSTAPEPVKTDLWVLDEHSVRLETHVFEGTRDPEGSLKRVRRKPEK